MSIAALMPHRVASNPTMTRNTCHTSLGRPPTWPSCPRPTRPAGPNQTLPRHAHPRTYLACPSFPRQLSTGLASPCLACHAYPVLPAPGTDHARSHQSSPRLPSLKLQFLLRIGYAAREIPERPQTVPLDVRTWFQMSLAHPKRLRAFVRASIY